RPSKSSRRLTAPCGPSNTYSFSTLTIGRLRRASVSSSRSWSNCFSLARSSLRATSHSSRVTIFGRLIFLSPGHSATRSFHFMAPADRKPSRSLELDDLAGVGETTIGKLELPRPSHPPVGFGPDPEPALLSEFRARQSRPESLGSRADIGDIHETARGFLGYS